jgi:hypothetical protein
MRIRRLISQVARYQPPQKIRDAWASHVPGHLAADDPFAEPLPVAAG